MDRIHNGIIFNITFPLMWLKGEYWSQEGKFGKIAWANQNFWQEPHITIIFQCYYSYLTVISNGQVDLMTTFIFLRSCTYIQLMIFIQYDFLCWNINWMNMLINENVTINRTFLKFFKKVWCSWKPEVFWTFWN